MHAHTYTDTDNKEALTYTHNTNAQTRKQHRCTHIDTHNNDIQTDKHTNSTQNDTQIKTHTHSNNNKPSSSMLLSNHCVKLVRNGFLWYVFLRFETIIFCVACSSAYTLIFVA